MHKKINKPKRICDIMNIMKKEIIIIGGGIVGSTAAYYLSKSPDLSIRLVDEGIGTATRAAAGIICPWMAQKKNKDWYRLTSSGAGFYLQLMADLRADGINDLPFQVTGTIGLKSRKDLIEKVEKIALDRREDAPVIGQIQQLEKEELLDYLPLLKDEFFGLHLEGGGRVDGGKLLDILHQQFLENGGQIFRQKVGLKDEQTVLVGQEEWTADHILLTAGAWLPDLLGPIGYQVDVRPQKGQLFELDTHFDTENWPVCMPYGEIDILPFSQGRIIVGATHEDDMGYDLELDPDKIQAMRDRSQEFMPQLADFPIARTRIGTRAYTSTYSPFYGQVADQNHLWVTSGLGSTGLTNGPYIGWQIAMEILGKETNFDRTAYTPDNYITKVKN